jgi:hypothetical protein
MQVWDDCLQRIVKGNKIGLGVLSIPDNEEMINAIKIHNEISFK